MNTSVSTKPNKTTIFFLWLLVGLAPTAALSDENAPGQYYHGFQGLDVHVGSPYQRPEPFVNIPEQPLIAPMMPKTGSSIFDAQTQRDRWQAMWQTSGPKDPAPKAWWQDPMDMDYATLQGQILRMRAAWGPSMEDDGWMKKELTIGLDYKFANPLSTRLSYLRMPEAQRPALDKLTGATSIEFMALGGRSSGRALHDGHNLLYAGEFGTLTQFYDPGRARLQDRLRFECPYELVYDPATRDLREGIHTSESRLWFDYQAEAAPDDPLYEKKGAAKSVSSITKGLGTILRLGGISVGPIGTSTVDQAEDQWGLRKVGFTPSSDPGSAWHIEDGGRPNVVVAVIDSGLDTTHSDAPRYLWRNPGEIRNNGKDDDSNGYIDDVHGWNFSAEDNDLTDDYGHGTFVAGIIAAKTNNAEGIAGINPGARIMVLKVAEGKEKPSALATYRAIRYAVDHGAAVLNISLGVKGYSKLVQMGINYAHALGRLVVVAAGNQGSDIAEVSPPGLRRSFAVAAVNMNGRHHISSNRGANVALAAPGESIYSLTSKDSLRDGKISPMVPTKYHRLSGTSFAAPFVAGVASLLWAKNPYLTHRQVEDILLASAAELETEGWDEKTGAGMLNAAAALSQDPFDILTVRPTEIRVHKDKRQKIKYVELYGIVRGNLAQYEVQVGKGAKPRQWSTVAGPSDMPADHGLLSRIDGSVFNRSGKWSIRIHASDTRGRTKMARLIIER